jgi:hypothetical protein
MLRFVLNSLRFLARGQSLRDKDNFSFITVGHLLSVF